jgi:hypothetical protein
MLCGALFSSIQHLGPPFTYPGSHIPQEDSAGLFTCPSHVASSDQVITTMKDF